MKWASPAILLLILLQAPTGGAQEPSCQQVLLQGEDGQPSRLSACLLEEKLLEGQLRARLQPCLEQLLGHPQRVFGGLRFFLLLDEAARTTAVKIPASAFDRTALPGCLERTLRRAFPGQAGGVAVKLEGRLFVPPEAPRRFSLELSLPLLARPQPLPPLAGGFVRRGDLYQSECRLQDGGRLRMQLSSQLLAPAAASAAAPPPGPVLQCRELASPPSAEAALRKEPTDGCRCLAALLSSPEPLLRVAAAEEMFAAGCWSERRKLFRLFRRELGLPLRAAKDDPPLLQPAAESERLRLALALVRSGARLPPGALERLAGDSSPKTRLRLLREIIAPRPELFLQVADSFLQDEDPALATRAAQLGCLLGIEKAAGTFQRLISDQRESVRLAALLLAPACLRGSVAEQAARDFSSQPLALLLLARLQPSRNEAEYQTLPEWLEHPCPIVRFLAGEQLARRGEPVPQAGAILEREADRILRQRLSALAAGENLPQWPVVQLWTE